MIIKAVIWKHDRKWLVGGYTYGWSRIVALDSWPVAMHFAYEWLKSMGCYRGRAI